MPKQHRRLYWIWRDMHQRCRNPKHRQFADYGGRGVTVCDRWMSFLAFEEDMGHRPDGLSLDRRDNALGYSPQNCRWATRKEQNSNRRNCIIVSCDGEDVTLAEYCRRKNMPYRPVVKRIQDRGWPVQLAITAPIGSRLRRIVA